MPTVDSYSLIELTLSLRWQSPYARHEDIRFFERFNVWRDIDLLPFAIQQEIVGREPGHKASHGFTAAELWEAPDRHKLIRIHDRQFNRHFRRTLPIEPRLGRFYPKGILKGVADVYSEDRTPMRLIERDGDHWVCDFNHPLASTPAEIGVEVGPILPNKGEHGGRCTDPLMELANGPGMQVRHADIATEFLEDKPFARLDEGPDSLFYTIGRMTPLLDARALQHVEELYGRLLQPGMKVLDLMASFDSHLPEPLRPAAVTGLGMNREELDNNPRLAQRLLHDLNANPGLPFKDGEFDAVICTFSVEYLTRPFEVFAEVARVLKPGGRFINVFSTRWFPAKVIGVWQDLHEFERPGLILEYYMESGAYEDLNTLSMRGFPRPLDDPRIRQTFESDPIHAVWGSKRA